MILYPPPPETPVEIDEDTPFPPGFCTECGETMEECNRRAYLRRGMLREADEEEPSGTLARMLGALPLYAWIAR